MADWLLNRVPHWLGKQDGSHLCLNYKLLKYPNEKIDNNLCFQIGIIYLKKIYLFNRT